MKSREDKYKLTLEENVFLAKKRWTESIYCGMRMENRNVTFPQTETILNGVNVAGVTLDDIQAVLNLRDAWKYLLQTLGAPLDVDFLCAIQAKVAFREALACGELRTGNVGISGVRYVPPLPSRPDVDEELVAILGEEGSATEKALTVFAWVARRQLFWDGNKRTALLAANKLLVEGGAGILLIPDAHMLEFSEKLSAYYECGDAALLKGFLYENAIFGIDRENP